MYDSKLWKIMEAYERMDEYPCSVRESIRVYNIDWDEDDLAETPELSDTTTEDVDVEYVQEYEGDHRGRTDEIEKNFREFYGCVPYSYDIELLNAEILESVDDAAVGQDMHDDGTEEERLANALYSADKRELSELFIQILSSISTLDSNSFAKVRNEFQSQGGGGELKNAVVNAMDFLLNG